MKSKNSFWYLLLTGISVVFLFSGCGSSSSGGSSDSTTTVDTGVEIVQGSTSLSGLDLADKVSVVDAKTSGSSASVASLKIGVDAIVPITRWI